MLILVAISITTIGFLYFIIVLIDGEKTKKMETETEFKKVEKEQTNLLGIKLEMDRDKQHVRRIRFQTEKGDITFKPSVKTEEMQDGFKKEMEVLPLISELHQRVKDWAKLLQTKPSLKLEVSYTYTQENNKDGELVTYRFINTVKALEDWKILGD